MVDMLRVSRELRRSTLEMLHLGKKKYKNIYVYVSGAEAEHVGNAAAR
jgi:hypothetical protein